VELAHTPHEWPPKLPAQRTWNDLGMIDRREDRHRVMHSLTDPDSQPAALAIVCELSATPDRGLGRFVMQTSSAVSSKTWLILTGGQQMRDRGEGQHIPQRIDDWRALALGAGVPVDRVVEIDLDHLTHTTLTALGLIAIGEDRLDESGHVRRLEAAFDAISAFAREWESRPDLISNEEQARLHQRIAGLYRDQESTWREFLRVPFSFKSVMASGISSPIPADLAGHLKSSAKQFASLLPDRLKRSPKWLAAGAAAGALGCVAAATFISPIAIGALPMWSAIGAAIGAVVQPSRGESTDQSQRSTESRLDQSVRSAALLAMVLELQGRDERTITRVLDEAIPEAAEEAQLASAADVQNWLSDTRHRVDLALARETR
jgi:hypothetical protein